MPRWWDSLLGRAKCPAPKPPEQLYKLTCYWTPEWFDRRSWNKSWYQAKPGQAKSRTIFVSGKYEDMRQLTLPTAFVRAAMMEGCAVYTKGRILNYLGRNRWNWLARDRWPHGRGASGERIVPYLSIAVDRQHVKLRRIYRIPELKGLRLPGFPGQRHRGIVRASDTGGAIKRGAKYGRIDLHVGFERWFRKLARQVKFPMVVHFEEVERS